MNTRDYKVSGVGEFYHVYNRGNSKNDIFLEDGDYEFFLLRLRQNLFPNTVKTNRYNRIQLLPEDSFSLLSYCLMPNHFHFLIKQNREITPSKLILKVCTSYSKYFNKKYENIGHVFQDRFKQILIGDDEYLRWLGVYIHQNPKVAGLVKDLSKYPWSSYPEYLNKADNNLCDKVFISNQFRNSNDLIDFTESAYEVIGAKKDLKDYLLD